ncbi:MAG: class I SAM-dependent methyltransferase [Micrococcales bacterium]|nr:class I SAM-dependent methyltransferase [Micrococcales bacterium]
MAGRPVSVCVAPGVFSAHRLDLGTSVLLRTLARKDPASGLPPEGTLVDLGCGWGPLALTMAMLAPGAQVQAIDINPHARELTRLNAERLGLTNIQVSGPTLPTQPIDRLWSNPPIRIGKDSLHDLLEPWLKALAPSGHADLVVQRHLGADSLATWLTQAGFPTVKVASAKGYRVLRALSDRRG